MTIEFPIINRTQVTNIVFLIFTKGRLLSKSTGGNFSVSENLISDIQQSDLDKDALIKWIQDSKELQGVSFTDDRVAFDGFPDSEDATIIRAWTQLAAFINKLALAKKHVSLHISDDVNEKFTMRCWLVRLGFVGPEFKENRRVLLQNLVGDSAFRTAEVREKWMARQVKAEC